MMCDFFTIEIGDIIRMDLRMAQCNGCGSVYGVEMLNAMYAGHRRAKGIFVDAFIFEYNIICPSCGYQASNFLKPCRDFPMMALPAKVKMLFFN